jgi:hypothetical protein
MRHSSLLNFWLTQCRPMCAVCSSQGGQALGPAVLFFGCRNASMDYIYQQRLEGWRRSGVLTDLQVAFSRDGPSKVRGGEGGAHQGQGNQQDMCTPLPYQTPSKWQQNVWCHHRSPQAPAPQVCIPKAMPRYACLSRHQECPIVHHH